MKQEAWKKQKSRCKSVERGGAAELLGHPVSTGRRVGSGRTVTGVSVNC